MYDFSESLDLDMRGIVKESGLPWCCQVIQRYDSTLLRRVDRFSKVLQDFGEIQYLLQSSE